VIPVEIPKVAPAVGVVSVTVGPVTLTNTLGDVAVAPEESVTRAATVNTPAVAGTQLVE
jgi:hypothetical protein